MAARRGALSWKLVTDALQAASLAAVTKLLAALDGQRLYALALYTSEGGMSVAMAANTEEAYQAYMAAAAEEDQRNTPEDQAYCRWASSEWALEGWESDLFDGANALIHQEDSRDFDRYFDAVIAAMTAALVGVKATLGERLADVTAFVTVTDCDLAEEIENASAASINAADLADAFRSRFD
jgi:hypothetical protein